MVGVNGVATPNFYVNLFIISIAIDAITFGPSNNLLHCNFDYPKPLGADINFDISKNSVYFLAECLYNADEKS